MTNLIFGALAFTPIQFLKRVRYILANHWRSAKFYFKMAFMKLIPLFSKILEDF